MSLQSAVKTLNCLQSNAEIRALIQTNRKAFDELSISETREVLQKVGISDDQLNSLNVIHVAGTKGKGTTCAFTESILRHVGLRTGFFSSPHIAAVRERIRINGKPLSEEKFAQYFFQVYNTLEATTVSEIF